MFDIGAAELLLIAIVALVVIGPKDLPAAMRGVGKVLGQFRSITGQFRFGLDEMIREAEMEEQEKEWAKKNADIMAEHPPQDESQQESDRMTENVADGDPTDGETKPLKSIATDDAGEISSAAEPEPSLEPSDPEPSEPSQPDLPEVHQQDYLFGDKQ